VQTNPLRLPHEYRLDLSFFAGLVLVLIDPSRLPKRPLRAAMRRTQRTIILPTVSFKLGQCPLFSGRSGLASLAETLGAARNL